MALRRERLAVRFAAPLLAVTTPAGLKIVGLTARSTASAQPIRLRLHHDQTKGPSFQTPSVPHLGTAIRRVPMVTSSPPVAAVGGAAVVSAKPHLRFLVAAQRRVLLGAQTSDQFLSQRERDALRAIRPPQPGRLSQQHKRVLSYVNWCHDVGEDYTTLVAFFAWLGEKAQSCQTDTLSSYRSTVLPVMRAMHWIDEASYNAARCLPLQGTVASAMRALTYRQLKCIPTSLLPTLFNNPTISTHAQVRLFLAFILHARAGDAGDLQKLTADDFYRSRVGTNGFWSFVLAGNTKNSRSARLDRLDHLVVVLLPPRVQQYLSAAKNGDYGQHPLQLQQPEQDLLRTQFGGTHAVKHSAIRFLSATLNCAQKADEIGQIAGRHLSATNPRNTRYLYTDLDSAERDLFSRLVPQALSLMACELCEIIQWSTVGPCGDTRSVFVQDLGIIHRPYVRVHPE